MNKRMIIALLMLTVMFCCVACGGEEKDSEIEDKIAELEWEFDEETGKLTIRGEGRMEDYVEDKNKEEITFRHSSAPWAKHTWDITSVEIEEGITYIGAYSFYECDSIEEVSIPKGVKGIGDYAFAECGYALKEIELPEGIKTIGTSAFDGCDRLESINLPDSIMEIGESAFTNCDLVEVKIPKNLKIIEKFVFLYCNELEKVYIPNIDTEIGYMNFKHGNDLVIYAKKGSKAEAYAEENEISFEEY